MHKYLLGLLLALVPFVASATDYAYVDKNVSVVAHGKQACYPEVLKLLTPEALKYQWRAADITFEGRQVKGCWTSYNEDYIGIVDAEGDGGLIPQTSFHALKEA